MGDEMRHALNERRDLIEQRADAVLHGALTDKEPWTTKLGQEPKDKKQREAWWRAARTIAAYRDRYQVTDDRNPLGPTPPSTQQKIDRARAESALREFNAGTPSPATSRPLTQTASRGPRL